MMIFDIKQSRRNGTHRSNKNYSSMMPFQPMTFLSERPDRFSKPVRSEKKDRSEKFGRSKKSDHPVQYLTINFVSLHQSNLMQ